MVCVRMHDEDEHDLSEGEHYIQNVMCNTAGSSAHFVSEFLVLFETKLSLRSPQKNTNPKCAKQETTFYPDCEIITENKERFNICP